MKHFSKRKTIILILIAIFFGVGCYAYSYLHTYLPADEEAVSCLTSSSQIRVEDTEDRIIFEPIETTYDTALIYYPGGKVEPESFAYAADQIAREGFLVLIEKMPYNLAIFDTNVAKETYLLYPEIKHWYLSGFSLGGTSACMTLSKGVEPFEGLILYASYTTENYDLSDCDLRVLSLSGTSDGLATPEKIEAGKAYLPLDTEYVEIEGGNHTQFAVYGGGEIQKGDQEAGIDRAKQQDKVIDETVRFLKEAQ